MCCISSYPRECLVMVLCCPQLSSVLHSASFRQIEITWTFPRRCLIRQKQCESFSAVGGLCMWKIEAQRSVTVGLPLQHNYPLKWNESPLSWLSSFCPILEKSKACIYAPEQPAAADPMSLSCRLSSLLSLLDRWGSMMKPGWSLNRFTTPTWERVGNLRKSSLWVFVSAVLGFLTLKEVKRLIFCHHWDRF